jgi:O-methyltransferase
MDPDLYIATVKKSLTCSLYEHHDGDIWLPSSRREKLLQRFLPDGTRLTTDVDPADRAVGKDHVPMLALTMVGQKRLDNLQLCVERVLDNDVPGDFIETGVWRGGCLILMRAILKARGISNRVVFAADSFEGMPVGEHEHDVAFNDWDFDGIAVSLERVQANLDRYGLSDGVTFVKGWFKDTLPRLRTTPLAVVRLDGDFYESTMTSLEYLYPRLSVGGYLIVDDYHCFDACRRAVDEYRDLCCISEPLRVIDWAGVYWRKER